MRKIQITSIVVASLLMLVSTAFGFGEIRYTDRPLNLRDGRSPKNKWVGNLYPGQKVRVAHLKDGWVAVYEPNATNGSESAAVGFSNAKYLKEKRTRYEPKAWGELVYATRALNVRAKAEIKGKKVASLKSWEHVRVDFPEGDWIMVFPPDATIRSSMNGIGYSSAKYFRPATQKTMESVGYGKQSEPEKVVDPEPVVAAPVVVAEATPAANGADSSQVSGTVTPPPALPGTQSPKLVSVTRKINVHQARTTGSKLVATLKPGDRVKIGLLRSGWYGVFGEYELVHAESRAMGYVLESLVAKGTEPATENVASAQAEAAPKLEPMVAKPVPVAKAAPKPKAPAAAAPKPMVKTTDTGQQTMVIDRTKITNTKRPDPTPNKSAHGYEYRFLEKSETRQLGQAWITLKVFLSTTKLPDRKSLEDFATTLWKDHRRVTKSVAVLVYLPGMDTDDLSYAVIKFDDKEMLELWVRKATLFGTKFL